MRLRTLEWLACPRCEGKLRLDGSDEAEIESGVIACLGCDSRYDVVHGVPCLLSEEVSDTRTGRLYGDIWEEYSKEKHRRRTAGKGYRAPAKSHLELMELASGKPLIDGRLGIDAGCGDGSSTLQLAGRFPDIDVVGIDISTGPFVSASAARDRGNAHLVRGNLLEPPLARETFDFAVSFGVLHHTPDPERAFERLLERLRPGGRVTIFLYKDFSDLPFKRFVLRQVNRLRRVTTALPTRVLRFASWIFAPIVFIKLTLPARFLRAIGADRYARHIPYGTFPHITSIASSLQDRFGAPYEFRFSVGDLEQWARRAGLVDARVVDCLPFGFSGLVLAGLKPEEGRPPA